MSYDLGVASEGERGNMDHTTTIEYRDIIVYTVYSTPPLSTEIL